MMIILTWLELKIPVEVSLDLFSVSQPSSRFVFLPVSPVQASHENLSSLSQPRKPFLNQLSI